MLLDHRPTFLTEAIVDQIPAGSTRPGADPNDAAASMGSDAGASIANAVCIGVSVLDRSRRAAVDRAGYAEQSRRMMGGAALAAAE